MARCISTFPVGQSTALSTRPTVRSSVIAATQRGRWAACVRNLTDEVCHQRLTYALRGKFPMSKPFPPPHKSGNGKLNLGPHLDRLEQLEAAVALIQQT